MSNIFGDDGEAEVVKRGPKNLDTLEVFLWVIPLVTAFVPLLVFAIFKDVPMIKYVLGGWNTPFVMLLVYLAVDWLAQRRLGEHNKRKSGSRRRGNH